MESHTRTCHYFLKGWKAFWIAAIIAVAFSSLMRLHTIHEPFERDITGHAYLGHQILEGKQLYVDVWDHKPPVTACAYAFFELIFGYNDTAIFALNVFFSALMLLFTGLIARELIGPVPSLAVLIVGGLILHSPNIQANQPNSELLINTFKLLGIFLLLRSFRTEDRRLVLTAAAGLAVGLSSAVKMITVVTAVALAAVILAHLALRLENPRVKAKQLVVFFAAAGAVWAAILASAAISGSLAFFWDAVIVYNADYARPILASLGNYFTRPEIFFPPFILWGYAIALLAIMLPGTLVMPAKRFEKCAFLLLALAAAVELAMPGYFFAHYYQLLAPFAVIAAIWTITELVQSLDRPLAIALVVVVASLVLPPILRANIQFLGTSPDKISEWSYGPSFVQTKRTGEFLRNSVRPGLSIFDWGAETGIYYYSKLDSRIPYFYYYPVVYGNSEHRAARMQRCFKMLFDDPPDLFVDADADEHKRHGVAGNINDLTGITRYLETNYTLFARQKPFMIYCHNRLTVLREGARVCDVGPRGAPGGEATQEAGP